MKGFALSDNDILIQNRDIQMVEGEELLCQTVRTVLNTNKGEWFLNTDEGINFRNILGKSIQQSETSENQKYKTELEKITNEDENLNRRLQNRLDGVD